MSLGRELLRCGVIAPYSLHAIGPGRRRPRTASTSTCPAGGLSRPHICAHHPLPPAAYRRPKFTIPRCILGPGQGGSDFARFGPISDSDPSDLVVRCALSLRTSSHVHSPNLNKRITPSHEEKNPSGFPISSDTCIDPGSSEMTGQEAPGSESGSQTAVESAEFRARYGDPRRICLPCMGLLRGRLVLLLVAC